MIGASLKDNIFALSTPVGGAIALLRASGTEILPVLEKIFTGNIEERKLNFGRIIDPAAENSMEIDSAMAVYFKAPHSYTGEDMFELNLHGSYAVVSAVSKLLACQGFRQAEPGEFTKRAFLNGKLDLIQADAVMDLILADTERSHDAALEQLKGGLSRRIAGIEGKLIDLGTELAAAMDYPDEMEDEVLSDCEKIIDEQIFAISALVASGSGRILREGAKVVILGSPNVGKSSLMNAMTGTGRAIVTNIAGTTRDIIEEKIDLRGYPIRLVDTAGLHITDDPVEKIGIERAMAEADTAQLIIRLFDGSMGLTDSERTAFENDRAATLYVINKCDAAPSACMRLAAELKEHNPKAEITIISCKTGEGMVEFVDAMLKCMGLSESSGAIVTNERHIACLGRAKAELQDAKKAPTTDLKALGINSALMFLGEITGRTAGEEILNGIFSRFCVGK